MYRKPWYSFLYVRSPIAKIIWGIIGVVISIVALLVQGIVEVPRMQAQTESWEGRSVEKGAEIFYNNCSNCHGPEGKGLPGVAPALHSKYFFENRLAEVGWAGSLEAYVSLTVHAGRPSKTDTQWANVMPTWGVAFGGPLKDDAVEHVTNYVLNWEKSALAQADDEDPWQPFLDLPGAVSEGDVGTAAMAEASDGPREPQELFTMMACVACHNLDLDQTDDERGPVAPNMKNLHETAGTKVEGQNAETYIRNSIINPGAYVNDGVMPVDFAEKMSEDEILGLVAWLLDPNRERE